MVLQGVHSTDPCTCTRSWCRMNCLHNSIVSGFMQSSSLSIRSTSILSSCPTLPSIASGSQQNSITPKFNLPLFTSLLEFAPASLFKSPNDAVASAAKCTSRETSAVLNLETLLDTNKLFLASSQLTPGIFDAFRISSNAR